jgi:cell division protein FtsN
MAAAPVVTQPTQQYVPTQAAQPAQQYAPAPQPAPQYSSAPVSTRPAAIVKPCLPDPGSTVVYRIQVGSFKNSANAEDAYNRAANAGFSPAYEQYQDYYRVIIRGVRAADMSNAAQLLGAVGFLEVLITAGN